MKITVPTIDFGTSKIVTLVAQSNGERCDIVGSGAVPYSGYLQDGWNNPDEIRDVIRTAIDQAQKTGNCRIHELNVGVPGMFTRVIVKEVHVSLTHVTAQDVLARASSWRKNPAATASFIPRPRGSAWMTAKRRCRPWVSRVANCPP